MKQNENTKYVKLGITGAAVLAFGFAIMYILNQSKNIAAGIQLVFNILKPFLYGALIAYLLAPICNHDCSAADSADSSAGMGQHSEDH